MDIKKDFEKGWHVESLPYFTSKEHALIGLESTEHLVSLDNIGANGENLTFAVLSMNRSDYTIRLMNSIAQHIPGFAGEFLIGDNGSEPEELERLYLACKQVPYRCRILEFKKNYGVGPGRNRLFAAAETSWLFSIDNDIYLVGNPLPKIQKDIAQLGCHFMNVPLLNQEGHDSFLYGGHLYIDNINQRVSAGGGSVLIRKNVPINEEHEPFLCTFLCGGASIIKRDTFLACDGYEKDMFVGFEDTELSVRLFQKGMKIGTCGIACLIHDHAKPKTKSDTNYEVQRFAFNPLKKSAEVFEKKHGFCVWNPSIDTWLKKRHEEILGQSSTDNATKPRPTITLVIDKPDWALDHVAQQVVKHLSDRFIFQQLYLSNVDNLADILLLAKDSQMIHFLWRPLASDFHSAYTQSKIQALGLTKEAFFQRYVQNKVISVGVYDHLLLEGEEAHFTQKLFSDPNSIVTHYTVSTKRLKRLYDANPAIVRKPDTIVCDGVDLSLFKPENLQRFQNATGRTLRIGWVGNSKWAVNDLKGIHTIIQPAIQQLIAEGYDIELITSDRVDRLIPHEQMPDFYHGIDIYACASLHEGTPNPILEAMACGVPVITTDVGLVPELFGPKQMQYVLKERTVTCMADTLRKLLDHPDELEQLSQENLAQIQQWDWGKIVEMFRRYFTQCLGVNINV